MFDISKLMSSHMVDIGVSEADARKALAITIDERDAPEFDDGWSQSRWDAFKKAFGDKSWEGVQPQVIGDLLLENLDDWMLENLK